MSNPWFRHYCGLTSDPKFGGIARRAVETRERVIFVWCCVLESASDINDAGRFDVDRDGIADLLHCETESIAKILEQFDLSGLTDSGVVAKWLSRQYLSDSSTDRVRKFRENKKKPNGNVSETLRNVPVTPPDTDADTDTEHQMNFKDVVSETVAGGASRKRERAQRKPSEKNQPDCPEWMPADRWAAFREHRAAMGKPITAQGATLAFRDLEKARGYGHDPIVLVEEAIKNGWTGCVFPDRHYRAPSATATKTATEPTKRTGFFAGATA
jgi:hypothetical protein